jgi:hypothetical protein
MSASGGSGDAWTLHATDRALIGNKTGATRLGFAVLLKLFAAEGRFPRCAEVLLAYRRRVGTEELYELRRHPDPIRLTLLAAFYHVRGREIADTLTDLLITTVHRIGAKAEKRVEGELMTDLKRVTGKSALLFKLAAASLSGMTTKTDTASEFRVSHLFTPPGILASWHPGSPALP